MLISITCSPRRNAHATDPKSYVSQYNGGRRLFRTGVRLLDERWQWSHSRGRTSGTPAAICRNFWPAYNLMSGTVAWRMEHGPPPRAPLNILTLAPIPEGIS